MVQINNGSNVSRFPTIGGGVAGNMTPLTPDNQWEYWMVGCCWEGVGEDGQAGGGVGQGEQMGKVNRFINYTRAAGPEPGIGNNGIIYIFKSFRVILGF